MKRYLLQCMCIGVLVWTMFGVRLTNAQDWMVQDGLNILDVHIQNSDPVDAMTGVTVSVESFPTWIQAASLTQPVYIGTIASSSTETASFRVPVIPGTQKGSIGQLLLKLTDDQGHTWTAAEKAALGLEIQVGYGETPPFAAAYGSPGLDEAVAIQQTYDGGYVAAGHTNGFVKGKRADTDIWVVKLDGNGDMLWAKTYGDEGGNTATAIYQTGRFVLETTEGLVKKGLPQDYLELLIDMVGEQYYSKDRFVQDLSLRVGRYTPIVLKHAAFMPTGYFVVGKATNSEVGSGFWLLKLDLEGEPEWQRLFSVREAAFDEIPFQFGVHASVTLTSVQPTNEGGYIMAGNLQGFIQNRLQGNSWILKLNQYGQIEWPGTDTDPQGRVLGKAFLSAGWDTFKLISALSLTRDGGYIVTGAMNHAIWVVRFNHAGDVQWQKAHSIGTGSSGSDVRQLALGDYIVVGGARLDSYLPTLLFLDPLGTPSGHQVFSSPQDAGTFSRALPTYDQGILAVQTSGTESRIYKFEEDHNNLAWGKLFGGSQSLTIKAIQQTFDGGYVIVPTLEGTDDMVVLKVDDRGDLPCFGTPLSAPNSLSLPRVDADTNVAFELKTMFTIIDTDVSSVSLSPRQVTTSVLCSVEDTSSAPSFAEESVPSASLSATRIEEYPLSYGADSPMPPTPPQVPEPNTLILVGLGLLHVLVNSFPTLSYCDGGHFKKIF